MTLSAARAPIRVCARDQLAEGTHRRIEVDYAGEPASVVVVRHQGEYRAYRNLCVHMPRELDCEQDLIFDVTGKHLRCSMHGIVYDPLSGESRSDICLGQSLTPVRIQETDDAIWITDKRVQVSPTEGG